MTLHINIIAVIAVVVINFIGSYNLKIIFLSATNVLDKLMLAELLNRI